MQQLKMFGNSDSKLKESFMAAFGEQSEAGKALAALQEAGQETIIQYNWISA